MFDCLSKLFCTNILHETPFPEKKHKTEHILKLSYPLDCSIHLCLLILLYQPYTSNHYQAIITIPNHLHK